jgi:predicted TIM-barrel fold metal-dependent hydrolase
MPMTVQHMITQLRPATLDRRRFLHRSGAAVAGAALVHSQLAYAVAREQPSQTSSPQHPLPVVDTHLHCFAGADDPRFPYHERAPYRPEAAATPEHLLACMDGAGVDYAIVVHPEPYQDDHRYLEHCLQVGGERLKGTCLFFADRPGSLDGLEPLVKRLPGQIVAARVHAYAPERLPPFGKPELRNLWKTAADLGLAMQLHFEPRYAPGFEPLIRDFKDTTVIIDHMGRPFQGTPEEHERVIGWSRLPNTILKIASVPQKTSYPHRDIGPVIRRLSDAYGAERMIYGGGFGADATPDSYRRYREQVVGHLAHLSEREQQMILGGTAARLFGFERSRSQ